MVRSYLYLASLLLPTSVALGGCRISYELLERTDGSLGGAGTSDGSGAGSSEGSGGSSSLGGADTGGDGGESGGSTSAGGSGSGSGGAGSGSGGAGGGSGGTSSGGSGGSSGGAMGSGGVSGSGGSGSGGAPAIDYPVTTSVDENDAGATVASPGQTGLSLREALTLANETPGSQTIGLEPDATLVLESVLPLITDAAVLLGEGASLDFSSALSATACIHSQASNVAIRDVEVSGCTGEPIFLADVAATGLELLGSYLHDNGQAATIYGVGSLVVGNRITGSGATGLAAYGPSPQIRDNQILDHQNAGIFLHSAADGALLVGNLVARADVGVSFGSLSGATMWFNTVHACVGFGVSVGQATGVDFRNNIVTGSGTSGVNAADNRFTVITHNLFFENVSGACNSCTPGAPALMSDPEYVEESADDFSLQLTSPAINAGVDVGEDRNGSSAGNFDGSAPDLGCIEVN